MGRASQRAGLKKNLFADLLASDVVQEIETLLGRQAVEDLDLEALELAVRQHVLQLAGAAVEQRLNADTSDERGTNLLWVWAASAICRTPDQTGGECPRSPTTGARLLSLRLLRPRLLSSRSAPGHRKYLALSGAHAYDWDGGGFGKFPGRKCAVDRTGRRGCGGQAGGDNCRSSGKRDRRR